MEAALAILASPAGQALVGAALTQAMSIAGGTPPLYAAADFAAAVAAYQQAVAGWDAAKAANPT